MSENEPNIDASKSTPSTKPLSRDASFWGMVWTQFLGAFNDNLFKQLMLLLAIPVAVVAVADHDGAKQVAEAGAELDNEQVVPDVEKPDKKGDGQALATIVFSLPFVLFSGFAGYLSDRYSKRTIINLSKFAEIMIMALGMIGFLMFQKSGYNGLLLVLFLMGTQSAFFGPGKYGILPELFAPFNLPKANGTIVMTTFLAIILGTVAAGFLKDGLLDDGQPLMNQANRLWIGSAICIAIAVVGTATSFMVRKVSPAAPDLKLTASSFAIPTETRRALFADRHLVCAILASSVFWLVSGIAIQAVNSLGITQLKLNSTKTSILAGVIAIGIAVGAMVAGKISRGKTDFRIVRAGMWGIVIWLFVLSISRGGGRHLLGFGGSIPVLILLGFSAGLFAIPLQVFIQSRPADDQKGQMIAVMNQANFIAILLSGVVYLGFDKLVDAQGWPRSYIFAMMAILVLPMAIFYRPTNDILQEK